MSVPVELGREAAQQAAREELAKQVYRDAGPGLTERVLRWLYEQAADLLDEAAGVSPGSIPPPKQPQKPGKKMPGRSSRCCSR